MKDFEVTDVNQLQYPSGHFDKAIMINGLHHFSDQEATHLLTSIRHVTKSLVIIIDIDGSPKGLIRRALVAMDRGRFMRNPSDLETLIARVFTIEEVMTFVKDERGRPILKGSLFFDVGNVWRRVDEFGESFKAGTGVGARVNTPIGPLRLDLGLPINKTEGESRRPRFHFNMSRNF